MFDLLFHRLIKLYLQYYDDINNYSKFKNKFINKDDRGDIITNLFSQFNIYDIYIINGIIINSKMLMIYFR
jgi:hypothetical protein